LEFEEGIQFFEISWEELFMKLANHLYLGADEGALFTLLAAIIGEKSTSQSWQVNVSFSSIEQARYQFEALAAC
jgi:hypothetical protein